jgi:hypothetical protein
MFMGRREDKLQRKLHLVLIPIVAVLFVVAKGELRFWFVGLIGGVVVGYLASGALVWFWVDVLKRPLRDEPLDGRDTADARRLQRAASYLTSCGQMTLPKALTALRIARRMEDKQTVLNTWATHSPNEVREFLLEQFAASVNETRDETAGGHAARPIE